MNLSNEKEAQREFPNAAAISHLLNPFIIPYKYTAGKYYRVGVKTKYFGFQTFRIHKGSSGKQCLISKTSASLTTFSTSMISFILKYNRFINLNYFILPLIPLHINCRKLIKYINTILDDETENYLEKQLSICLKHNFT